MNKSVGNKVDDIIPPCATNINVRNKTYLLCFHRVTKIIIIPMSRQRGALGRIR